jgi:hypothetical protein
MSAGTNALAAVSMADIVMPIYKKKGKEISPKKSVVIFKCLCEYS